MKVKNARELGGKSGNRKTEIQEPISLLPQTGEHVLLDINICLLTYVK